jgi:hypothetical protein
MSGAAPEANILARSACLLGSVERAIASGRPGRQMHDGGTATTHSRLTQRATPHPGGSSGESRHVEPSLQQNPTESS